MSETTLPISADLLEILRDPYALQQTDEYGDDPGQLELVNNAWLVSKDTGYKYPIKDGIPVMLIEEGARWKDTPIDELPETPPETAPPSSQEQASTTNTSFGDTVSTSLTEQFQEQSLIKVAATVAIAFVVALVMWRLLSKKSG